MRRYLSRVKHYVAVTRPINSLATGLSIALITGMFSGWRTSVYKLAIGFITGLLGSASAMVINDYVDRDVDAINKPWKPVPKGLVKPVYLVYISATLYATIVLINTPLGYRSVLTVIIYASVSILYSFLRRFWWSQLIVPFSTTSSIIYSYVLSNSPPQFLGASLILSLSVYLAMLGREIIKAVQDKEGDLKAGYVTIPLRFGTKASRITVISTTMLAVMLNYLVIACVNTTPLYIALVTLANAIYVKGTHTAVKAMFKPEKSFEELENARKKTLYASIIGLISYSTLSLPPINN